MTNGPRGLAVPEVVVGTTVLRENSLYYVVLTVALLSWLFVRNLVHSRVGLAWRAIRDREIAAAVFGVGVARYKTLAFGISAAYAGLAGSLFAITVTYLDPDAFNLWESVKHLTLVLFGGLGTLLGPPVGATILTAAPEFLTPFREHALLVFYLVLLLVLLFLPGGVTAGAAKLARSVAGRVRRGGAGPLRDETGADAARPADDVTVKGRVPDRPRAGLLLRAPSVAVAPGEVLLDVKGVTLKFGGLTALDDVDLIVHAGEIKGLIGPNGAGKTSLFNVLTRVYRPQSGRTLFAGEDLARSRTDKVVARGIARTFQNVEIFRSMTVLENVLVGAHHSGSGGTWRHGLHLPASRRDDRRAREEGLDLLAFLDLDRFAHEHADVLPLGLQRRVEIARALAARPALLLLDEPASGLTAGEAARLMEDVEAIRDNGTSVLLIEHNMRFVMGLSHSITALDHGSVIFDGTPAAARLDPDVVRAYLGDDEVHEQEQVHGLNP
jgi:ABC-type branched-subunit amino acid transport system ATPase component